MDNLWLGIGWRRAATTAALAQAIVQLAEEHRLDLRSIQGLGTVHRQTQELGILEMCQTRRWQLRLFTAAELAVVIVPHPSMVVQAQVGTASVAEAAALLAAGQNSQLLVSKQIYRLADTAVTIAVAQAADRADKTTHGQVKTSSL